MLAITSVRDRVADRFLGFQITRNIKESCRGFVDSMVDLAADRSNLLVHHPEDFDLYVLGWFDEDSGRISFNDPDTMFECPRRIFTGSLSMRMIKENLSVGDMFEDLGSKDISDELKEYEEGVE